MLKAAALCTILFIGMAYSNPVVELWGITKCNGVPTNGVTVVAEDVSGNKYQDISEPDETYGNGVYGIDFPDPCPSSVKLYAYKCAGGQSWFSDTTVVALTPPYPIRKDINLTNQSQQDP